jgi:hypothetical protein
MPTTAPIYNKHILFIEAMEKWILKQTTAVKF